MCENSTRQRLKEDASSRVVDFCMKSLFRRIAIRPQNYENGLAVLATGDEDSPSLVVMLNHEGRLIDQLTLKFIKEMAKKPENSKPIVQQNSEEYKRFEEFLRKHDPSLIVIDASSLNSHRIKKYVEGLHCASHLKIEFVDEDKVNYLLELVKQELDSPFKDMVRKPSVPMEPKHLFSLLTGETVGVSIRVGQVLTVRVISIKSFGVRVRLENALLGFIRWQDFVEMRSDRKHEVRKKAVVGMQFLAKVKEILFDEFQVRLSTRLSN
jgi:hypothetical protein